MSSDLTDFVKQRQILQHWCLLVGLPLKTIRFLVSLCHGIAVIACLKCILSDFVAEVRLTFQQLFDYTVCVNSRG